MDPDQGQAGKLLLWPRRERHWLTVMQSCEAHAKLGCPCKLRSWPGVRDRPPANSQNQLAVRLAVSLTRRDAWPLAGTFEPLLSFASGLFADRTSSLQKAYSGQGLGLSGEREDVP